MKPNRFFRIMTVTVILSLLMLAISVTPALAAAKVTLGSDVGKIGDKVNIEGEGFPAGQGLSICFSSQQVDVGKIIGIDVTAYSVHIGYNQAAKYVVTQGTLDPAPGKFAPTFFYVPSELNDGEDKEMVYGGIYYIYVANISTDVILAKSEFTIIGIKQLTPPEGPVGTRVTIEGVAFQGEEPISTKYDGSDVAIASGESKTDRDGDFTCKIDIPASTVGVHTVTAIVAGVEGDAQFIVVSAITASPPLGGASDEVTVTGTGFGGGLAFTLTFDGDKMNISGDSKTDAYGSFESTFIVPSEVKPGTHEIRVEDNDNNTAEAEFIIATNLVLSSGATAALAGHVGMDLTISGTNFKANYPITITYAITAVETKEFSAESEADGSFSYAITVPTSEHGVHIITATDGTNNAEARFFMESTPPQPPSLLLPALDTKAKARAHFGWEDATDDSQPVTYDLQVASDENFTTILVDKRGLTASEYTLLDSEKLGEASEETPYYWHVRAIDAASNVGNWSNASAFYVGATFTGIHGWLLYFLIAIGVLGAFILGFWLGRRPPAEEYW